MRRRVYEIREPRQRGREAYDGPVERRDEDLGVRVEGLCGVEVVGDEGGEPLLVGVDAGLGGAGDAYVGAAGNNSSVHQSINRYKWLARAYALKKRPLAVNTVTEMSSRLAISRRSWETRK